MSFVKKAVKKVFKFVKRVVKSKVFKIVAIAALTFFTAGVAAGGFAAFSGASGLSGFFTAVGQTIATGASSLASMVGLKGVSAGLAKYGGAAAVEAGLTATAAQAGLGTITATASKIVPGVTKATSVAEAMGAVNVAQQTTGGFMGAVKGVFGKKLLGDVTVGQMVATGVAGGISNVIAQKAREEDPPNVYVAGGLAFGGPKEAPSSPIFEFGEPAEQETFQTEAGRIAATEPSPVDIPRPTEAVQGIRNRLYERGLMTDPAQQNQYAGQTTASLIAAMGPQMQGGNLEMQGQQQAQPNSQFVDTATQLNYNPKPRYGLVG